MDKHKPDSSSIFEQLGVELEEAQAVLVSPYDITGVFGWLSKEGTLYFSGGIGGDGASKLEQELIRKGYHVVPRF